jgi:O-antigen/teichoic acid export membrane protein
VLPQNNSDESEKAKRPQVRRSTDATAVDTSRVRGNAILTLVGAGFGAVLMLTGEVIAVRFLGAEFFGYYAIAFVIARIAGVIAGLGLRTSIVHFVPVFMHRDQPAQVLGTVATAIAVSFIFGSMIALAIWQFGDWAAAHVFSKPAAGPMIAYAALLIPLLALVEVLSHVPRAFDRSLAQVVTRNLVPPAAFALLLLMLTVFRAPPIAVVTAQLLAQSLAVCVGIAFVVTLLRRRVPAVRPVVPARKLLHYSIPVVINDLLVLGMTQTGLLILGVFAPAEEVGIYRVCVQVSMIQFLFLHAVGLATGPLYPALIASGDRERLVTVYNAALGSVRLMVIPLCMIIVFNAGDILALFDPDFVAGKTALRIQALGQALAMCYGLAGMLLVFGGRPQTEMRNSAIAFVSNIILNLALIPAYGLEGAALATAISFAIISLLRVRQARRFAGVGAAIWRLLRVALVSGTIAFAVSTLATLVGLGHGSGNGALAIRFFAFVIVLAPTLWLLEGGKEAGSMVQILLRMRRSQADEQPLE